MKYFQKTKLFVRILIETRIITKALFKIPFKKTFHKPLLKLFSKPTHYTHSYRDENHYKDVFKIFSNPHHKEYFKPKASDLERNKDPIDNYR